MSNILSCLPQILAEQLCAMALALDTRPEVIAEAALAHLLRQWELIGGNADVRTS
jgi:hypothetical protein